MLDTKETISTDKIKEPAKQWRNKYRALRDYLSVQGNQRRTGQEYWGSYDWPSREIAEAKALQDPLSSAVTGDSEWLGAFPVTP